jgi:cytochrome c551/c552
MMISNEEVRMKQITQILTCLLIVVSVFIYSCEEKKQEKASEPAKTVNKVKEKAQEVAKDVEKAAANTEAKVEEKAHEIANDVEKAAADMTPKVEEKAHEIANDVKKSATDTEAKVEEKAHEIANDVEQIASGTTANAEEKAHEIAKDVEKIVTEAESQAKEDLAKSDEVALAIPEDKSAETQNQSVEKPSDATPPSNETATPPPSQGETLFKSNICSRCHKPNQDTIGPSLAKIAKTYKEQGKDIVPFFKGEQQRIVDHENEGLMKTQIENLKKMPDADLRALADYILQGAW